jgi:hypothetical protein
MPFQNSIQIKYKTKSQLVITRKNYICTIVKFKKNKYRFSHNQLISKYLFIIYQCISLISTFNKYNLTA